MDLKDSSETLKNHYACPKCGHREMYDERMRVYEIPDWGRLRPIVYVGWCRKCVKVVEGEYVPSRQELREELSRIKKDPDRGHLHLEKRKFIFHPDRQMAVHLLEEYILWRKTRKNPSRCFECGSTEISLPDKRWNPIPCPRCDGMMEARLFVQGGTFISETDPDVYSPEGDLLHRSKSNSV